MSEAQRDAEPASACLHDLGTALGVPYPDLSLRRETEADNAFNDALYRSVRWEELAPVPWPDQAKIAFLDEQSGHQRAHYRAHYPGALLALICAGSTAIGRIYVYFSVREIRLMDIALLPEQRGRGIGGTLIRALMQFATETQRQVTLHVEPNNPAHGLYQRLGFATIEARGVYDFLGWSPERALPEREAG